MGVYPRPCRDPNGIYRTPRPYFLPCNKITYGPIENVAAIVNYCLISSWWIRMSSQWNALFRYYWWYIGWLAANTFTIVIAKTIIITHYHNYQWINQARFLIINLGGIANHHSIIIIIVTLDDVKTWKRFPHYRPRLGCSLAIVNTLRPRQNGRNFPDDILKCVFFNENLWISLKISLKFGPKVRINIIPALVQIMAWHRPGDKPLSEPMMVLLLTHICVTRPQWVKFLSQNTRDMTLLCFFYC